jgi:hypothetical protein
MEVINMSRLRRFALVAIILLFGGTMVAAEGYVVILKSGHKLRCKEPMQIQGSVAILTLSTGTVTSYPLQLVDVVETERYNQMGLGDALMIEELSVDSENLPTPTPRAPLGSVTSLDVDAAGEPVLGGTLGPTPTPTPGIELQTTAYHDERIDQAFAKIFDEKELLIYQTSQGTQPEYFFVRATTDSEAEVFEALKTVAEAYVLIDELHKDLSPNAVELQMVSTSGKPAGTFRLTPALAKELVAGTTATQTFYIKHVIF